MKNLVLYIHGKNGSAEESEHYKKFFPKSDVIGFDYKSQNAWDAKKEFQNFFGFFCENYQSYQSVKIIANSIGAFFTMHALSEKKN